MVADTEPLMSEHEASEDKTKTDQNIDLVANAADDVMQHSAMHVSMHKHKGKNKRA